MTPDRGPHDEMAQLQVALEPPLETSQVYVHFQDARSQELRLAP